MHVYICTYMTIYAHPKFITLITKKWLLAKEQRN